VYQLKNHNLEEAIETVEAEAAVEEEVPVEEIKDKEIAIKIKKHQRLMLMIIVHSQLCDENF
jgi:penicillin-binding protein-related factor A (putative recombinase)